VKIAAVRGGKGGGGGGKQIRRNTYGNLFFAKKQGGGRGRGRHTLLEGRENLENRVAVMGLMPGLESR